MCCCAAFLGFLPKHNTSCAFLLSDKIEHPILKCKQETSNMTEEQGTRRRMGNGEIPQGKRT